MGTRIDPRSLYERDFYAWTQEQARELREFASRRPNVPLDLENLAEEIESMGNEQAHAVESHIAGIIEHLLKLEHSPAHPPRGGWRRSVINHRYQLGRRLDRNPKLGSAGELAKMVPAAWKVARDLAVDGMHEHGEDVSAIPEECPYDLGQIRGDKRYPANRHGIPD